MTDNKYCKVMSGITLSDAKKENIKLAIKHELGYIKEQPDTPVIVKKQRSKGFRLAKVLVPLALVAAIIAICVYAVMPSPKDALNVRNPLTAEDQSHILNVTSNAQYLPNAEILASANEADTLASEQKISEEYNGKYTEAYRISENQLNFTIEDYNKFNDSLAVISETERGGNVTVYDIKEEIEFAVNLIPGYDQWFRLNTNNIPHLSEDKSYEYAFNSYKLSYDKESGKITMLRLTDKVRGESYDKTTSTFYSDAYTSQLLTVEFYINEAGKEVVDCKIVNYLHVHDDVYYPVSAQRLINVKDSQATKYAVTYARNYDLVKEIQNNLSAYDVTDISDKGLAVMAVQLDYTSADDISMLKTQYFTQDSHNVIPTFTAVDYYRKNAEGTTYFTSNWHNASLSFPYKLVLNYFIDVAQSGDGTYIVDRKTLERSFSYMGSLRWTFICEDCKQAKNSSDGIFIDCKHGGNFPNVISSESQILSNDSVFLSDPDSLYGEIADKFSSAASVLGISTQFETSSIMQYKFQNSVNDFLAKTAKDYYKVYLSDHYYAEIDKTVNGDDVTDLGDKDLADLLKGKYTFTYDINDLSSIVDGTVNYHIEMSVSVADEESTDDLYIVLIVRDSEDPRLYAVADKVKISSESVGYTVSGSLTFDEVIGYALKAKPLFKKGDVYLIDTAIARVTDDNTVLLSSPRSIMSSNGSCDGIYYFSSDGIKYQYEIKTSWRYITIEMKEDHVDYIYPYN